MISDPFNTIFVMLIVFVVFFFFLPGGKVKSSSGVQAETVLHLSDPRGMEEWMCVRLIPSHSGGETPSLSAGNVCCSQMKHLDIVGRFFRIYIFFY